MKKISVLLACQNEEHLVGLSIVSFLRFADEIIVVENGSIDRSAEICDELASVFPNVVKFISAPDVVHLYENRQIALRESTGSWIVRADADYVCYSDGKFDSLSARQYLLHSHPVLSLPRFRVPHASLFFDFFHTVKEDRPWGYGNIISRGDERIYHRFSGMRFERKGRWEGLSSGGPRQMFRQFPSPIWMHCDIKSPLNMFYRRYRTDWRENGDFLSFPTLDSYILARLGLESVESFSEVANAYVFSDVVPYMRKYEEEVNWPVPKLVCLARERGYGYVYDPSVPGCRRYSGPPPIQFLKEVGRSLLFSRE